MNRPWRTLGAGWIFALLALLVGIALLFSIGLGSLTPHLVAIAIILLALALLL